MCFPAGLLLRDARHGGPRGAHGVTAGVSRESYARLTPVFGGVDGVWRDADVSHRPRFLSQDGGYSPHNTGNHRGVMSAGSSGGSCPSVTAGRRLCLGHVVFIRAYSGNGARSEPLYSTKTEYYDILEVTPTATHAQIKTAYYKQSFIYHPDRNAGSEEATVRFSEISEAYTVLGNKALRKKYDRGLLTQSDLVATGRPSAKAPAGGPAKHQGEGRRSVMGAAGQGGVFDFDKFFKAHYGQQLQREKDIRVRKEEMLRKKQEMIEDKKLGGLTEIGVGFMLLVAWAILVSLK